MDINHPAPIRRLTLPSMFFLHNRCLDSTPMEFLEVVSFPSFNTVYICPVCSDAWGRWLVDDKGWNIAPAFCPKHCPKALTTSGIDLRGLGPNWLHSFPGGSFLQHLTLTPDRLPPTLLEYEFNLWSNFREHASN